MLRLCWILCTGSRVLSSGRRSLRESFNAESPAGDTNHTIYAAQPSQPGHRPDKDRQTHSDWTDLFRQLGLLLPSVYIGIGLPLDRALSSQPYGLFCFALTNLARAELLLALLLSPTTFHTYVLVLVLLVLGLCLVNPKCGLHLAFRCAPASLSLASFYHPPPPPLESIEGHLLQLSHQPPVGLSRIQ